MVPCTTSAAWAAVQWWTEFANVRLRPCAALSGQLRASATLFLTILAVGKRWAGNRLHDVSSHG